MNIMHIKHINNIIIEINNNIILYPILLGGGTKYWPLFVLCPPHSHPLWQKSPCQGAEHFFSNNLHIFHKNIEYWLMDGTKIGLYFPPHPHPQCCKQSLPGGRTNWKTIHFFWFYKNSWKRKEIYPEMVKTRLKLYGRATN